MRQYTFPRWAATALLAAAGLGLVVALWFGGGAEAPRFSDPGALVRWGAPIAKLFLHLSTAITVAGLLFALFALPKGKEQERALGVVSWGSAAWTISGLAHLVLTYVSAAGVALDFGPAFGEGLWLFVTQIELGTLYAFNLLGAALVALLAVAVRSQLGVLITAGIAVAAVYPMAETGHASADTSHSLAVNSMLMHLLGVSVWLGGLVLLFAFRHEAQARFVELIRRYSNLALISYIAIAVSGVTSALLRIPTWNGLLSEYGLLVLAKVGLFVGLGAIGFLHRRWLVSAERPSSFWRLATVELAIMGLTFGIATALSRTAPPVIDAPLPEPTPAQLLTGDPLPPPLTPLSYLTVWDFDVLWLTVCGFAAYFYLAGVARLRARGDSWSLGRTSSWLGGILLLGYVTNGALNAYQEYLFSVHMIGHMVLSMFVPILLVLGAPVTLLSRAVVARKDGSRGMREWVLWAVHTPYAAVISHPIFAALNFALSLVLFYYTPLFRWATEQHLGHQWMLVHFLITGYLFAQALIGVDPMPHKTGYPLKLMLLIGTMGFHAFFGLSLMNEQSLLLADWFGSMGRTWGEDPLTDQSTGGAIAWGIGELPTLLLVLAVVRQWSQSDAREQKRSDRASDRSGNDDLAAYNEMLAQRANTEDRRR